MGQFDEKRSAKEFNNTLHFGRLWFWMWLNSIDPKHSPLYYVSCSVSLENERGRRWLVETIGLERASWSGWVVLPPLFNNHLIVVFVCMTAQAESLVCKLENDKGRKREWNVAEMGKKWASGNKQAVHVFLPRWYQRIGLSTVDYIF